ncbi:PAS-domain containing protein [Kiloniella sp.]|uniref:PAS-domain containing protein n=1 Tax=Kiloniella sp. TaxID=1938587 RepID=UPI003B028209
MEQKASPKNLTSNKNASENGASTNEVVSLRPMPEGGTEGAPTTNAFAIFNTNGNLTNYSENFKDYFPSIANFIEVGAKYQVLIQELVLREGADFSVTQRDEWSQRLYAHRQGELSTLDLTGLGKLRISSTRSELQDGTLIFSFDNSAALPTTLNEIMHLNRQVLSAIDDINEGFVLYDPNGKMIYCNARHRELYPEVAHLLVPGSDRFEVLEVYWEKVGRIASKFAHGTRKNNRSNIPRGDIERQLPNGRWLKISEKPTHGGGLVAVRTDITELKENQTTLFSVNERLLEQTKALEIASLTAQECSATITLAGCDNHLGRWI